MFSMNSCEAKETAELEAKKDNEGTEMPDMTTTTSHMPEDYANLEVMTAWQAVQMKENNGKLAKLKLFGEKTSQKVQTHLHIFLGITFTFCFREESSA